jgi:hypothetical protein
VIPDFRPGPDQLPPALGVGDLNFAFHFTEPELAWQIIARGHHPATQIAGKGWGIYLSTWGPHNSTGVELLERLFAGNANKIPNLWGTLVYRIQPDKQGLPVIPDPTLGDGAFFTPVSRSGFAYVYDYVLAIGVASFRKGSQWMWYELARP